MLQTWSQLFSNRNNNTSSSKRHCDLIENMLYELLTRNPNNIEFQNIAIEAVLQWIFKYLPQIGNINGKQPSITKLLTLSKTILQISPFPIHKQYISSIINIQLSSPRANSINSHEFAYLILQEVINRYNQQTSHHHKRRTLKSGSLNNIKSILTQTTNGRIDDPQDKYLYIVLQIVRV